jgi:tetratricopeptide (TPR) repeat protein
VKRFAIVLAAALVCSACRGNQELELRYEAERLRWKIDQAEARQAESSRARRDVAQLRRLHEEVHRRFGADSPPTAPMLNNPDTVRRLRIAGTSSLYGADLAATFHPSREVLAEYEHIASVYAFDREIGYRALYGKARLLEKLGRPAEALEVSLLLLSRYPPLPPRESDGVLPALNPVLLDLEVHTLALAKYLDPETFAELCRQTLPQLRARAQEWAGTKLEHDLAVHLAHALFVADEWDEGLRMLERAHALSPSKPLQIEHELEITQILWRGKGDLAGAQEAASRAIESAKGSAFEGEARMDLAKIFLEQKKYSESIEEIHELLRTRPRVLEGLKGEAFYWEGMVLVALEQWEDAFPRLESVAEVDAEGSWAIEARTEIMRDMRALRFESGEEAARGVVESARRVRNSSDAREPPFGWDGYWWRPQEDERWQRCVDGLREVASTFAESDFAAAAREQAERLESERIFHPVAEDSSAAVKPSTPGAETDAVRETS